MKKTILRIVSSILILSTLVSPLYGCNTSKPSQGNGGNEDKPVKLPYGALDISEYSIVYPEEAEEKIVRRVEKLRQAIEKTLGLTLSVITDATPDNGDKEILIGNTNRERTADAAESLAKNKSEDAFIVDIGEGKIVILGKTVTSTSRSVDNFISKYIMTTKCEKCIDYSAGKTAITPYDVEKTVVFENGVEIDIEAVSTIVQASKTEASTSLGYPTMVNTAHYPSVIELQHNGSKNGTLVAIFCLGDRPVSGAINTSACVIESTDGGETWKQIARPAETKDTSIRGISMASLYELPAQVGDMPAGTLLYTGNSVNYNRKSHIAVWRSFDCGYTWEEYVIIAEGGGTREGVWEPVMWYEKSDGYLYCFYSDDSDPAHDQKLVYKRSKDGVVWSDIVPVCEFDNPIERPGMFVMTKLGNGLYFMVYEYYGAANGLVYYKITRDVSDWNPAYPGTLLQATDDGYRLKGAPSCIWSPAGGKNGTLIATGKLLAEEKSGVQPKIYISFDYGKTWDTIENFLPYDPTNDTLKTNRIGHRPSFFVGSDPSVIYMMNNTDDPETGMQRMQFARIRIYD